jgi:hypothetical protein
VSRHVNHAAEESVEPDAEEELVETLAVVEAMRAIAVPNALADECASQPLDSPQPLGL